MLQDVARQPSRSSKAAPRPNRQQAARGDPTAQLGDNLFLRATVDRTHVMQGEQVNLVVQVVHPGLGGELRRDEEPDDDRVLGRRCGDPEEHHARRHETVNGKSFRVGVIKRVALFPDAVGTLEIGPMEVQTTVQVQSAGRMIRSNRSSAIRSAATSTTPWPASR